MTERTRLATEFLANTEWSTANWVAIAGDASRRRYDRLTMSGSGQTAIMMDAPPEEGEDVRPFIRIDEHLCEHGFSAPRILASDPVHGFLLLEDLGDDLYARVVKHSPTLEDDIYRAATDVLVDLHQTDLPDGLADYGTKTMTDMAALSHVWYRSATAGHDPDAEAQFHSVLSDLLSQHITGPKVMILRDYHADNLLWLPRRSGVARVGLLDFQDAMTGHRAYDLVSLLQDARRDVPQAVETEMIRHYLARTGLGPQAFETAYNLLGVQRNLRILGVFARLCLRDGKAHYVDFIPRVWGYLNRSLAHPALADLAKLVHRDLPAPDTDILKRLKDQCASRPTP